MADIIAITNTNTSMMKLLVKKFCKEFLGLIHLYHAFLSNQKFLSRVYMGQYILLVSVEQ